MKPWVLWRVEFALASDFYDYTAKKKLKTFEVVENTPQPEEWQSIEAARQKNEKYLKGHAVDAKFKATADAAQVVQGGIDFNPNQINMNVQDNGHEIRLNVDPAMLQRFENAPGFVPVILDIQSLPDLKMFLGVPSEVSTGKLAR